MKIAVPSDIVNIAKLLDKPIYVVGGFVRDSLFGYEPHDIDLAGDISPEELTAVLTRHGYKVKPNSPKLMTVKIISAQNEYEYTAFRTDSYVEGHSPAEVKRTDDINKDALRRDFTVNAIYYDPLKDEITDPLNGLKSLEKREFKMTRDDTFTEDGLRLMRLCRQSAELGFSIEENTLTAAKENVSLLKDISPERIRDELDKILVADVRYSVENAHYIGLLTLDKIGAFEIILPEITAGKNMPQRADFHRYDVFGHILHTVKFSSFDIRLAALLHDCAKPYCYNLTGRYRGHDVEGARIAEDIMNRLRYPKSIIQNTKALVNAHMFDLKCEARENTVRRFIQANYGIFDELLKLKQADFLGSGIMTGVCPGCTRLNDFRNDMIKDGTPLYLSDLKVNGKDLADMGVADSLRGKLLNRLLQECALKGAPTDRDGQLKILERLLKEET